MTVKKSGMGTRQSFKASLSPEAGLKLRVQVYLRLLEKINLIKIV